MPAIITINRITALIEWIFFVRNDEWLLKDIVIIYTL